MKPNKTKQKEKLNNEKFKNTENACHEEQQAFFLPQMRNRLV